MHITYSKGTLVDTVKRRACTYCLLGKEGPEDVYASLAEVGRLAVVLVAQGDQIEQLHHREDRERRDERSVCIHVCVSYQNRIALRYTLCRIRFERHDVCYQCIGVLVGVEIVNEDGHVRWVVAQFLQGTKRPCF